MPKRIWCKICGITHLGDALMAQQAGADALGFNCYPHSPRYLDPQAIAVISEQIAVTKIALFVNPDAAAVNNVLAQCSIDMLQFQGDESAQFCESFDRPYIKAVRMHDDVDLEATAQTYRSAWALMLDAYVPGLPGGTGATFDWQRWPENDHARWVLAGGLTPDNVGVAIERLDPFGVDVCGGLEGVQKGRKDHNKVTAFLQEVRRVRRNTG